MVIVRDQGLDLGVPGYEIGGSIIVHHMNPIQPADVQAGNPDIVDPEYLVCVSEVTHNSIHVGRIEIPDPLRYLEPRQQFDTSPWLLGG